MSRQIIAVNRFVSGCPRTGSCYAGKNAQAYMHIESGGSS